MTEEFRHENHHQQQQHQQHHSYYQKSILNLINTVRTEFRSSLNEEEDAILSVISTKLSMGAQRLLFRLLSRKRSTSSTDDSKGFGWFLVKKITYKDIEDEIRPLTIELIEHGFLLYACDDSLEKSYGKQDEMNENIQGLLSLQTLQELKELSATLNIDKSTTTTNREGIMAALLEKRNQKRLCNYWKITEEKMKSLTDERHSQLLKASRKQLGMIVKVSPNLHVLFDRLVTLFNVVQPRTSNQQQKHQSRLSEIILNDLEDKRLFMTYALQRTSPLFPTREASIEYEDCIAFLMAVDDFDHSKLDDDNGVLLSSLKMDAIDRWHKLRASACNDNNTDANANDDSNSTNSSKVVLATNNSNNATIPNTETTTQKYFLSKFKSASVICKSLHNISTLLERKGRYTEANEILNILIGQGDYLRERRLRWIERLCLNLQKHLREPGLASAVLVEHRPFPSESYHSIPLERRYLTLVGAAQLSDSNGGVGGVNDGNDNNGDGDDGDGDNGNYHPSKTAKSTKKTSNLITQNAFLIKLLHPKQLVIYCDSEHHSFHQRRAKVGSKLEYFDGMGVEQMVQSWFKLHFDFDGEHSEGGVLVGVFGLLFWDIIFAPDVKDVFQSPYQSYPLDLMVADSSFYLNRKDLIDGRIESIKSIKTFSSTFIDSIPDTIINRKIVGVDWDRKEELASFVRLMECHPCFSELFWPFIRNYREASSGLPDLFLYRFGCCVNESESIGTPPTKITDQTMFKYGDRVDGVPFEADWKFIMVEVKSPRDKLSDHQRWWNDYLLRISMPVLLVQVLETSEEGKDDNKNKNNKKKSKKDNNKNDNDNTYYDVTNNNDDVTKNTTRKTNNTYENTEKEMVD